MSALRNSSNILSGLVHVAALCAVALLAGCISSSIPSIPCTSTAGCPTGQSCDGQTKLCSAAVSTCQPGDLICGGGCVASASCDTCSAASPCTANGTTCSSSGYCVASAAPAKLSNVSGSAQIARVETELPQPLVVLVVDANGNAASGVTIDWAVVSGGGSVSGNSSVTGADGQASISATLGGTAGANSFSASASGLSGSPVAFTATGTAGDAAALTAVANEPQSPVAGTAISLTVLAADAEGNPVADTAVTWAVGSGGGSVSAESSMTGSDGQASISATLGGAVGTNTFTASAPGLSGSPVTFTLGSVAGAAAKLQAITSSNQQITVATTMAIVAEVTDVNGNPVAGTLVQWSATAGGGGTAPSSTSGANGEASITATLGEIAGVNTFTASFTGLTGAPATFSEIGIAGAPSQLAFVQTSASASSGSPLASAQVAIEDAFGNLTGSTAPVAISASGGTATLSGGLAVAAVNGVATFPALALTGTAGSYLLTATSSGLGSATKQLTLSAGAASALVFTQVPTSIGSDANMGSVKVAVEDGAGNVVLTSTAPIAIAASGGTLSGGGAVNAVAGVASFNALSLKGVFGTYSLTASSSQTTPPLASANSALQLLAGAPAQLTFVDAPPATAQSGAPLSIVVGIKDSAGNFTSSNAPVSIGASGGTLSGGSAINAVSGVATFENLALTALVGNYTLTASSSSTNPAIASVAGQISITAGTTPSAASSTVSAASGVASGSSIAVSLQAKDAAGNLITAGGATVAFAVQSGTGSGSIGAAVDNGNGTYSAQLTGILAGTVTVKATLSGSAVASSASVSVSAGTVASAANSIVSAPATDASGSGVTVSLQAKDAAGNTMTTGGAAIAFSVFDGSGTGSLGGAATDNGDGTYSATFTGAIAGTVTLKATVNGTLASSTAQISVNASTTASASTSTVTAPANVASGLSITATLQARDAAGNAISSGGQTVVFSTQGGPGTGTFGATTDHNNGTYTASFTGAIAGAVTLGATLNNAAVSSTAQVGVSVGTTPSAATSVLSAASGVVSGSSIAVVLQAKDAAGNTLTSGGATVVFSVQSGTGSGTFGGTVDSGNGTYTAPFTGVLAGTVTLKATLNSAAVSSTAQVTVSAGTTPSAATSTLSAPTGVMSGSSIPVTLQAKDAAGNSISSGGATVVFSVQSGTGTGNIGTTVDNGNGTYSNTVQGEIAGTLTVKATLNSANVVSTAPVSVSASTTPSDSTSTISAPSSDASGTAITVTVQARDAAGNTISSGGASVVFSLIGGEPGTGALGTTTDNHNGTYSTSFTGILVGQVAITASINGGPLGSNAGVLVGVGPASASTSTLLMDNSVTVVGSTNTATARLHSKDAAGNTITTGGANFVLALTDGTGTGSLSATTDNGDGTYSAVFTGTLAGTVTLSANLGTTAVSSTVQLTVVAGMESLATSTVSAAAGVASGSSTSVTLQLKDSAGNLYPYGGDSVLFAAQSGTGSGTIGAATDNNNGTYTASFTGVLAGTVTVSAKLNNNTVSSTAQITVSPGTTASAAKSIVTAPAGVASGSSITVSLQAKDAAGNSMSTGGATVAFSTVAGSGNGSGTFGSTTDNHNGTYSASFTGALAGTLSIGAMVNGAMTASTAPVNVSASTTPSAATSAVSAPANDLLNASITVSLQAMDAAGNLITSGGATVAFSVSNGTGAGSVGATTDNHNGTYSAPFTGSQLGTVTLQATVNSAGVTSTAPVLISALAVSPSAATLQAGQAPLTLSAVAGSTAIAASWSSVSNGTLAVSSNGTLSSTSAVSYTPPANVATVTSQSVTATSGSASASSTLTLEPYGTWANWTQPPLHPTNYTVNGNSPNDTVTDNVTGLIWQRTLTASTYLPANAINYCQSLNTSAYGGYTSGWRLPTRIELASILDYTVNSPSINATYFPSTPSAVFWTSSPYALSGAYAWGVDFQYAFTFRYDNTAGRNVRCVR